MKMLLCVCSLLMGFSMIGLALSDTFIEFSIFVSILSFFNSIVMSKITAFSSALGLQSIMIMFLPLAMGPLMAFLKLPITKTTELLSDDGLRAQQYNGGYKNWFIESIFVMLDLLMLLMTTFS